MKKIKNPVTVLDHLTNRMIDDHNMKEKEQPKDESKEDEFIELDVPIKTPLWEDDETKEVKEGGELFTKGEWAIIGELQKDKHMCPVPYYEIGSKDGYFWTAHVNASDMSNNEGEAEANAALISQSKNMYYALKAIVDNWDQHMIGDKEQLKKNIEHDIEYWSPSASMINSEHIANAREILLKATHKK